jgi:hypothetical protein
VRFENLNISTKVHVGSRALPSLTNYVQDIAEVCFAIYIPTSINQLCFPFFGNGAVSSVCIKLLSKKIYMSV